MINKVILMGRLTRDPALESTKNGKSMVKFTVAVDRRYGEAQTDFINCVAWNNQADFMDKYFKKGMMIIVSGRIQVRTWTDRDGKKNYATEVIADEVNFGESRKQFEEHRQAETPAQDSDFVPLNESDVDLPF